MALPSTGQISFQDIQNEFGGSNPIGMDEYYAGGSYVQADASGVDGAIPASGAVGLGKFRGSVKQYALQYLLVGGGGGGGEGTYGGRGGGGAGGLLNGNTTVSKGTQYIITVGAGGPTSTNGDATEAFGLIARGGGYGGGTIGPSSGGSGGGGREGGGAGSGVTGQGNSGGSGTLPGAGGGGGGAGGAGAAAPSGSVAGAGGIGRVNPISGSTVGQLSSNQLYLAGGGGGVVWGGYGGASGAGGAGGGGSASSGAANTGGGSGAGSFSGGSGVVVLSIPTTVYSGTYTGSSVDVFTSGNDTILQFKSSGTYTA